VCVLLLDTVRADLLILELVQNRCADAQVRKVPVAITEALRGNQMIADRTLLLSVSRHLTELLCRTFVTLIEAKILTFVELWSLEVTESRRMW
jgi:hypothetical protein